MWASTTISGRSIDIFLPEHRAEFPGAVLFLHGYSVESLRTHAAFSNAFSQLGLPVVCPLVPKCWWLNHLSPEFDAQQTPYEFLTSDLIQWIESEWKVSPPNIALLGVSTGAQGVLQVAYRNALRFPVVAAISPAIDFDRTFGRGFDIENQYASAEAARQDTVILNLHPLNWPKAQFFCSDPLDAFWHDGAIRLASKLSSSGIPHTCDLSTSHGGHGWQYFDAMASRAISFIGEGLKRVANSV